MLDVGLLRDGSWAVVEANASWSSNPYHADPTGVVASVLAAQGPQSDPRWTWRSDPAIDRFARPLPVRSGAHSRLTAPDFPHVALAPALLGVHATRRDPQ